MEVTEKVEKKKPAEITVKLPETKTETKAETQPEPESKPGSDIAAEQKPEIKAAEIPEKPTHIRASKPLGAGSSGTFNLKNIFDEVQEEKEEIEDFSDKPRDEFTSEDLNRYWQEFLAHLQKTDNTPIYNALSTGKVELKDNFRIEFTFNSSSQVSEFDDQREVLVNQLREKLNNYGIEIAVKVEQNQTVKYVQTKEEIFEEMKKKNPTLGKMKDQFGLNIEQ